LWNYLNDPAALPAPSFSYWMPLPSLVGAGGLVLVRAFGVNNPEANFWGARLGFFLLAACVPPLTALLSYQLTHRTNLAIMAGVLALFPGFYLAFMPTTDSFPITMVLGALFLLVALRLPAAQNDPVRLADGAKAGSAGQGRMEAFGRFLLLGLLAGALHMARADGLLWLAGIAYAGLETVRLSGPPGSLWSKLPRLVEYGVAALCGYLLAAGPWFARNLTVWNGLFPPGGARGLWLVEYDRIMTYPPDLITPQAWLNVGWGAHFQAWAGAAANHLQTTVAVQGTIVLFPFMVVGVWLLRRCMAARLGALMWLLTAAVMTLAFPFAGVNGAFFHSGAALQPFFWAAAPLGVERVMIFYAEKRRLPEPLAMVRFMLVLLVFVCMVLSGVLFLRKIAGDANVPSWGATSQHYEAVEAFLIAYGAAPGAAVMVNNPPGFWLASGRPAVVVPYGDEGTLLAAARAYGIDYLILERNNPAPLGELYHERVSPAALEFLGWVEHTRLYRICLEN
jgi:hypothetical protein